MKDLFTPISTPADLSVASLEWAASMGLPPSYTFELHVPPSMLVTANILARHIGADQKNHPFAPYINVVVDTRITSRFGWFVQSGDVRIGSEGVV